MDCHLPPPEDTFDFFFTKAADRVKDVTLHFFGGPYDRDVSQGHFKQYQRSDQKYGSAEFRVPVSAVVTPKDCSRCHPDEAQQYALSKHANTLEIIWKIDPWLNQGMNSEIERTSGCFYCHGTVLKSENGVLDPDTWPNVGVGRLNLDGSLGSCSSCHMSGAGTVLTSHDVTERLSWETQAPLSIRPEEFAPFPAKKMLDGLYGKGLLDKTKFFDERLEVEYYELWHHEGRRARMGVAMMAPDYAWWHGFYECKKRYVGYMEEARELIEHGKPAYKAVDFPNATGDTTRPPELKFKHP
jgi:hypothetical protein